MVVTDEVLERYRAVYGLDESVGKQQVQAHWLLETQLTQELLDSSPETRWATFSRCYTQLYTELPWLNHGDSDESIKARWAPWMYLPKPSSRIFEIGSGGGELLKALAAQGHQCVATEITQERGAKHQPDGENITWHLTDGVNLTKFEPEASYDLVISSQVIEHFHPEDLVTHLKNARAILKPGGRYVFDTPHRGTGPHDLSLVFGHEIAACMHLKEYTYPEIDRALRFAGFSEIRSVGYRQRLSHRPHVSSFTHWLYCASDTLLEKIRLPHYTERKLRFTLRGLLLPNRIWISAQR